MYKKLLLVDLLILAGCVNYKSDDFEKNFSDLLSWQGNGDLVLNTEPSGFVDAIGAGATVIDGSLTGTVKWGNFFGQQFKEL